MKKIVHEARVIIKHFGKPYFYSLSNNGLVDDIFYYLYVEIIYAFFNRVQYTSLEYNATSQDCSRLQLHGGYHTGGKVMEDITREVKSLMISYGR